MSKKLGIIFFTCWFWIGLGITLTTSTLWGDIIRYGFYSEGGFIAMAIAVLIGSIAYITLTLLFIFNKSFRGNK